MFFCETQASSTSETSLSSSSISLAPPPMEWLSTGEWVVALVVVVMEVDGLRQPRNPRSPHPHRQWSEEVNQVLQCVPSLHILINYYPSSRGTFSATSWHLKSCRNDGSTTTERKSYNLNHMYIYKYIKFYVFASLRLGFPITSYTEVLRNSKLAPQPHKFNP